MQPCPKTRRCMRRTLLTKSSSWFTLMHHGPEVSHHTRLLLPAREAGKVSTWHFQPLLWEKDSSGEKEEHGCWADNQQSSRTTIYLPMLQPVRDVLLPPTPEVTLGLTVNSGFASSAPSHTPGEMSAWVMACLRHKMECDLWLKYHLKF